MTLTILLYYLKSNAIIIPYMLMQIIQLMHKAYSVNFMLLTINGV